LKRYKVSEEHITFFADAISCSKEQNGTTVCNGIPFVRFIVRFWEEKSTERKENLQVAVHASSCWSVYHFLDAIEEVSRTEQVLSLIHGYYINGKHFLFITINSLHHHLFKIK
jgi:hypothetical protein